MLLIGTIWHHVTSKQNPGGFPPGRCAVRKTFPQLPGVLLAYVRLGLNSHWLPVLGDGHQPGSRGFYIAIIRFLLDRWDYHPQYKEFRPQHIWDATTSKRKFVKVLKNQGPRKTKTYEYLCFKCFFWGGVVLQKTCPFLKKPILFNNTPNSQHLPSRKKCVPRSLWISMDISTPGFLSKLPGKIKMGPSHGFQP